VADYDYVIVGAGSAGCVLANRLSTDPSRRVLLLEAGGSNKATEVKVPAAFSKLFRTERDWDHNAEPDPNLKGRALYIPRGKMLGGSSSMNAMIYIRGRRYDFDTWETMGAKGWSYDEILPYFKRSENNQAIQDHYHGVGGELNVSDPRDPNPLTAMFIDAAVAAGYERNPDFNGAYQEGFGYYQVTQKRGSRHSTADAFLEPAKKRPNLTVHTHALALRIVFDGNRAVGVDYRHDGNTAHARAAAEVVVAAGAINSPQLLMLSGVGPADHLREHGIPVVVHSPHVGGNLQDHPVILQIWESKLPISLHIAEKPKQLLKYLAFRKGMLTSNVGEGGGFVHTRPGLPAADIQFHFGPAYYAEHGFETHDDHAFSIGPTLVSPEARGTIRLRSADPATKPAITGNYLAARSDMEALVEGIKIGREIVNTGAFDQARGREIYPGNDYETDAELEEFVRQKVELLYHPSGTCAMGKADSAVVDPELRVYGTEALRVVDASVMPIVTGGNTNAPTIMIAEKAAESIVAGSGG
jgi:choline dehydrogenase